MNSTLNFLFCRLGNVDSVRIRPYIAYLFLFSLFTCSQFTCKLKNVLHCLPYYWYTCIYEWNKNPRISTLLRDGWKLTSVDVNPIDFLKPESPSFFTLFKLQSQAAFNYARVFSSKTFSDPSWTRRSNYDFLAAWVEYSNNFKSWAFEVTHKLSTQLFVTRCRSVSLNYSKLHEI